MEQLNHNSNLNNKGYSTAYDNFSKPRHRWYYYKESFSNDLVQHAIEENKLNNEDLIFDPFVGSGTVNLCASQNKINSVGIEVNPFAYFLSRTKHINCSLKYLKKGIENDKRSILRGIEQEKISPFLYFSTFSELTKKDKWLFNSEVLNCFEGGYNNLQLVNQQYKNLFKLSLLNAVMDNCNAKKDGKCLRYKTNWEKENYSKYSFTESFNDHLNKMIEDLNTNNLFITPTLYKSDSRIFLKDNNIPYKLCITSPPYLNSFDYTDVYRPELFLGRFVNNPDQLKALRLKTLCSHTNFFSESIKYNSKSLLYNKVIEELVQHSKEFWNNKLSQMVQLYFKQMEAVLKRLLAMGKKDSTLWMIVANSAYFNYQIPTDLILAEIGTQTGWKLKEITVLRDVFKRGSKYSPDVHYLRESAIVFKKV